MSAQPLWQDEDVGAAKRVAHYLDSEVGEGGTFSMQDLRKIVPGKNQVDRRMRDLRKVNWVIRNYKDKGSLKPEQLYLEKIGDRVWEDGYKWPTEGISAATRRKVIERDGAFCRVCFIDFGEEYPHLPGVRARGTIGHIVPQEPGRGGSHDLDNLRPECHLCNETLRNMTPMPADVGLLKTQVLALNRADKRQIATWMLADRRPLTDVDRFWAQYRQLPQPAREEIRQALSDAL